MTPSDKTLNASSSPYLKPEDRQEWIEARDQVTLTQEDALRRIAGYARKCAEDGTLYENEAFADIERTACIALEIKPSSVLEEDYSPSILGSVHGEGL